jgi:hypothetical protein
MGMRGDGDEAMSDETNIELLEKIVFDQREIITDVTGKDITEVPQMWALYKLKPMEYPISFWLDYAWKPERIGADDLPAYTRLWAKEQFVTVYANIFNPRAAVRNKVKGFVEADGYISIEAANYTQKNDCDTACWEEIPGLGRTISAMHPVPVNSVPVVPGVNSPVIEYDLFLFSSGVIDARFHLSPTQNIYNDEGLEFAVSIDDNEPQIINIHNNYSFRDWEKSVLDNTIYASTKLNIDKPGNHTLKIWMVDPGIVLQKIVLYTTEPHHTYLGSPESIYIKN